MEAMHPVWHGMGLKLSCDARSVVPRYVARIKRRRPICEKQCELSGGTLAHGLVRNAHGAGWRGHPSKLASSADCGQREEVAVATDGTPATRGALADTVLELYDTVGWDAAIHCFPKFASEGISADRLVIRPALCEKRVASHRLSLRGLRRYGPVAEFPIKLHGSSSTP